MPTVRWILGNLLLLGIGIFFFLSIFSVITARSAYVPKRIRHQAFRFLLVAIILGALWILLDNIAHLGGAILILMIGLFFYFVLVWIGGIPCGLLRESRTRKKVLPRLKQVEGFFSLGSKQEKKK